ncbi:MULTISPECIES: hypothetical protein [unclassified Streptomyces]|uniref:hypothetical protein n=1 Tax=unclassified Streptomyces TaxID=2593676 RepID=UPI0004CBA6E6|nr:hypothetical protein [Streptomyces sp. NRRL F-2747]
MSTVMITLLFGICFAILASALFAAVVGLAARIGGASPASALTRAGDAFSKSLNITLLIIGLIVTVAAR